MVAFFSWALIISLILLGLVSFVSFVLIIRDYIIFKKRERKYQKMKTKSLATLLCLFVLLTFSSCTENQRAKTFGGTMTVQVPPNEIFVNATWKEQDLWIITHDTCGQVYYMHEYSSFGLLQGTVIIKP